MIEAEAKKTICPKMSGYVSAGVEGNVDFYECLCFGSACQWWEPDTGIWNDKEQRFMKVGEVYGPEDKCYEREIADRGHCGAVK